MSTWKIILLFAFGIAGHAVAADGFRVFFVSVPSVNGTAGRIFHRLDLIDPNMPCMGGGEAYRLNVVDQEGGRVRRFQRIPGRTAEDSGAATKEQLKNEARSAARQMQRHCVHVNLAPVADAHSSTASPLRTRSYSSNAIRAHDFARTFANQMRENGIVPTWKHFPGHSQRTEEVVEGHPWSHFFANLRFEALVDFADSPSIEAGIAAFSNSFSDLIMLSQSVYPAVDFRPAVLVPEFAALARDLQPNSLLISDDLSELRLSNEDILLVFRNVDILLVTLPADVDRFERALQQYAASGLLSIEDIRAKYCRQQAWRHSASLPLLPSQYRCEPHLPPILPRPNPRVRPN